MLQLYLNYKLKSVAHLPWRQMTYKFLNTVSPAPRFLLLAVQLARSSLTLD